MAAQPRSRETVKREEEGRTRVISAIQTALANAQCQCCEASRDKVRAIADELQQTSGETLRTRQGMYALWAKLEDACPAMRDYIWMTQLREMQREGMIPKFSDPAGKLLER